MARDKRPGIPLDYPSDSQPADRALWQLHHFHFIFLTFCSHSHSPAAAAVPRTSSDRGSRLPPSGGGKMFHLFMSWQLCACEFVCVSSCVYIKRIIFAYFFTHSDCLALLIGVFCASEIFAFCAHFYTKKKS